MQFPAHYSPYFTRRTRTSDSIANASFQNAPYCLELDYRNLRNSSTVESEKAEYRWIGILSIGLSITVLILASLVVPFLLSGMIETNNNVKINSQLFRVGSTP